MSFPFCYGLNVCVPPKFRFWSSIHDMTVSGGRAALGVIKVKWDPKGGSWSDLRRWSIYVPSRWGLGKKEAVYKPREDAPERKGPFQHFDLGLPASRTVREEFLLLKPPNWWYYVTAALNSNEIQCPGKWAALYKRRMHRKVLKTRARKRGDKKAGNYLFSVTSLAISVVPGMEFRGSVETNLTSIHEDAGSNPDLISGLRIQHCHELERQKD